MPSVSYAQHLHWNHVLEDDKATDKDKNVAKEFLAADKSMGKYQDGFAGIVAAVIKNGTKTLILYHNKTKEYTLPTGKVEYKEKDEEAVIRECEEETGLKVTDCTYKGFAKFKPNDRDNEVYIRIYKVNDHSGAMANKEPKKHASLRWLSKQEINNLIRLGQASETIKKAKKEGWL